MGRGQSRSRNSAHQGAEENGLVPGTESSPGPCRLHAADAENREVSRAGFRLDPQALESHKMLGQGVMRSGFAEQMFLWLQKGNGLAGEWKTASVRWRPSGSRHEQQDENVGWFDRREQ